jgi:hypothetical protein
MQCTRKLPRQKDILWSPAIKNEEKDLFQPCVVLHAYDSEMLCVCIDTLSLWTALFHTKTLLSWHLKVCIPEADSMNWDVCQVSLAEKCYFAKLSTLLFYGSRKTQWRKCGFTSIVNVAKSVINVICVFGSCTYTTCNLLRNFVLETSQLTQIWRGREIPWASIHLWWT